jgi:hypothetical protein
VARLAAGARKRIAKENKIRDLQIATAKRESAQAGGASRFALEQLGQSGVDRSIVEGAGKIGTQDVQSMLFKPGRSGTLPTITPPTLQQGLDTIQARTNQAALQQALGPRSNLSGDEARGFIDAQSSNRLAAEATQRANDLLELKENTLVLQQQIANFNARRDQFKLTNVDATEELGALRPSAQAIGENAARLFDGSLSPEVLRSQIRGGMNDFNASAEDISTLTQDALQSAFAFNDKVAAARQKRWTTAFEKSLPVARDGNAANAFAVMSTHFNGEMSKDEMTQALVGLSGASAAINLGETEARKLGGVLSIRRGLTRIEQRASNPALEASFGAIQGRITDLQAAISNENLRPDLLELLVDIGFTAEQSVRLFSGAAVRDEEEERFRSDFIGALKGGRESLLAAIPVFREGLEDVQIGIAQGAMAQRGGNLLMGVSSGKLSSLILDLDEGDPVEFMATKILVERGVLAENPPLPALPSGIGLPDQQQPQSSFINNLGKFTARVPSPVRFPAPILQSRF